MACSWSAAASPPPPRMLGNDLSTLPDFPAEIRAPAGTPHGVSAFQIHFASRDILTPGDHPNTLVAMNPAALNAHLGRARAGRHADRQRGRLHRRQPAQGRLRGQPARGRHARRLPGLPRADDDADDARHRGDRGAQTGRGAAHQEHLRPRPDLLDVRAAGRGDDLLAGGEIRQDAGDPRRRTSPPSKPATTSARRPRSPRPRSRSSRRRWTPGEYRNIDGAQAMALGLIAASVKSGLQLFFASYPITPASELLHHLARHDRFGVRTVQAEDEIAAANMALGAAFAGQLGITATSGPGMDLKAETIGLAAMLELPLVIIDVQRAGPSTGMPTKTEQTDLLMAIHGRHGESPLPVIAAVDPGRLLRLRGRGRARRGPLPDAGDPARRHLPRQLLRALADPRHRRPAGDRSRLRRGRRTPATSSSPTCATSTAPGPGRSPARPASSTGSAASRRRTAAATSATTPPTTR